MRVGREELRALAADWLKDGKRVLAPRCVADGRVLYAAIQSPEQIALEGFLRPRNSIKEAVFPRHEALYRYRIENGRIELTDALNAPEQVVLGARPCDAAALPILDAVFGWDSEDEFYKTRRLRTTVVTMACDTRDDSCFCTSVGLAPDATNGSDAMLYPAGDGYEVVALTEKGRGLFPDAGSVSGQKAEAPARQFDPAAVRAFVESRFEDPLWDEQALRCLGCGACAYTCPTCHCFDIVDEHGARVRNWDSCQFALFTLHASGHNPRGSQPARQRQRVLHKFSMYPERFGSILCTGCGNCTRNCPVNLGLLPLLKAIDHAQPLQA